MLKRLSCLFAIAVFTATGTIADAQAQDATSNPDAQRQQLLQSLRPDIERAEAVGARLFTLDRAAWIATDVMQADRSFNAADKRRLRGWITRPDQAGTDVMFFDDAVPVRKIYQVHIADNGTARKIEVGPGDTFNTIEMAEIRARAQALQQKFSPCSRSYNSVVYSEGERIIVYLMPGTTRAGLYPAGGHYRFEFDQTGENLLAQRAFTNACIDLDSGRGSKAGHRLAMMAVSHLLDPQPTEIHVFISLSAPVPLAVMTVHNKRIWEVTQGRIVPMTQGGEPAQDSQP